MGPAGDDPADLLADERFAVAGEPAGEMVLAVLGGEVADENLPPENLLPVGLPEGAGGREDRGKDKPRPGRRSGVVELPLQGGIGLLQAGAAGDDEEAVRHQPHHPLDQPLQITVSTVAGVLEGVEQDHRHDALARR